MHHKYRARAMAVGDTFLSAGVNGHMYLRRVTRVSDEGFAWSETVDHSYQCGCLREPWEFDPVDAY